MLAIYPATMQQDGSCRWSHQLQAGARTRNTKQEDSQCHIHSSPPPLKAPGTAEHSCTTPLYLLRRRLASLLLSGETLRALTTCFIASAAGLYCAKGKSELLPIGQNQADYLPWQACGSDARCRL